MHHLSIVLLLVIGLVACGGTGEVALADLAAEAERYEGQEVTVRGSVVAFDDADGALDRHIVVEDESNNRVELLPLERAEAYIGQDVEVTGTFTFEPTRGRAIEISSITAD